MNFLSDTYTTSHLHHFLLHTIITGPVTNLSATSTTTSVSVNWGPPTVTNGAILRYVVKYVKRDDGSLNGTIYTSTNVTDAVITELLPGTEYNITVSAENDGGFGNGSIVISATQPNGMPN